MGNATIKYQISLTNCRNSAAVCNNICTYKNSDESESTHHDFSRQDMKIFTGNANPALAQEICKLIDC